MLSSNWNNLNKWDKRFLGLAGEVATWSKDPRQQVGAVLISPDKSEISYGYNGFPRRISDNDRLTSDSKNTYMVHAELNALLNAKKDLSGWSLYVTKAPCANCCKAIIQANIIRLTCPTPEGSWEQEQWLGLQMLKEAGLDIVLVE